MSATEVIKFWWVGDFRQTLPVVPRGTSVHETKTCLKSSLLWRNFAKINPKTNLCVNLYKDSNAADHSTEVLKIGDGLLKNDENKEIYFKDDFWNLIKSEIVLIDKVYPDISNTINKQDWLCERTLVAPMNDDATNINRKILSNISDESSTYSSVYSFMDEQKCTTYPIELLNSVEMSDVPKLYTGQD